MPEDPIKPNNGTPAYEPPDVDRPASAAPTEPQLERELPGGRDAGAGAHDPYAALRNRNFRLLASGFFLTFVGGQMQVVAAQYELYTRTGSKLSLGVLGGVLAVPMLLLALPSGQLADTFSRRRIVLVMLLANAACSLGLAWLSHFHHDWRHSITGMYVLLGLGSAAATVGRPARTSLLPQLVPPRIFSNAVTWNSSIFETASMFGPLIGGFLVARSIPLTYAAAAACWLACFGFVLALPDVRPPPQKSSGSRWTDLLVGLRFVARSRIMLGAMTLDLFAVLFGGATFLFPVFAKDILNVGPLGFAVLRAAPAVGAFSMAIYLAQRPPIRHAGRALLLAVAGFGLATIVFGLSKNIYLSCAMLVLTGMFDNVSVVVRHTLVQMLTPDAMRGRVSAVNQIFIGSSNEIGGLESGVTAAWWGPVASVVVGGIGTLLVVSGIAVLFPQVRRLGSLKDIRPVEMPELSQTPAPALGAAQPVKS